MDFTQSGRQEGGLASQRVMEMAISPTVGLGHLWWEMKGILAFVRQQRPTSFELLGQLRGWGQLKPKRTLRLSSGLFPPRSPLRVYFQKLVEG
jgi:hypothetical protein